MTQTPRDWQKDMEMCRPGIRPELTVEQTEDMLDALYYYMMKSRKHNLESVARKSLLGAAEDREQRLKEAVGIALGECKGEPDYFLAKKIRSVLSTLYPDTPAPKEGVNQIKPTTALLSEAEAQAFEEMAANSDKTESIGMERVREKFNDFRGRR